MFVITFLGLVNDNTSICYIHLSPAQKVITMLQMKKNKYCYILFLASKYFTRQGGKLVIRNLEAKKSRKNCCWETKLFRKGNPRDSSAQFSSFLITPLTEKKTFRKVRRNVSSKNVILSHLHLKCQLANVHAFDQPRLFLELVMCLFFNNL